MHNISLIKYLGQHNNEGNDFYANKCVHERFSNWPQFVMRDFETRKWVLITKEFLNVFQELWCGLNVRLFRRYLHHPVPHWVAPLSLVNETGEKQ